MPEEPSDPPDINEETREAFRRWSESPEVRATMKAAAKGITEQSRTIEKALNQAMAPYREYSKRFDESLQKVIEPLREQNRLVNEAVAKALPAVRNLLRLGLPANIRQVEHFDHVGVIAEADGIPLVHVPRSMIVTEVLEADNSDARRSIIEIRTEEILDDCLASLSAPVNDAATNRIRMLALRTVDTYRAGFFEAAQSVAVSLSEGLIAERVHKKHSKALAKVEGMVKKPNPNELIATHFNSTVTLWVVPTLYRSWEPETQPPVSIPVPPSRHVTTHHVTADNVNPVNAVITLMQVASLVAAVRWDEEWKAIQARKSAAAE